MNDEQRLPADLDAAVQDWIDQDPDPITQAAAGELLTRARRGDDTAIAELQTAFAGPLAFGTAGLRGPLGPGPGRMNRVVVTRAAAGLGAYLLDEGLAGGIVLVGHDHRYNSDVFARDTVEVLAGIGFDAVLIDEPTPTPVVAFGIRHLGAVAGVVVTASHNPATDNGYKVYLGDGCQIVPPADQQIAHRIAQVATVHLDRVPRADSWRTADGSIARAYLEQATALAPPPPAVQLRWVHTAMHGVASHPITELAARTGHPAPVLVAAQAEPDPAFSTVPFPNPEEPGALDLALRTAANIGADLIIANDPDADRCSVAIPTVNGWRRLTGDEVGWLLADDLLRHGVPGVYATTVVSSTLLAEMAAAHGQEAVITLTGFKWLGRVPDLVFGYEEAIGYCCHPTLVADKDGLTAALRVLALASEQAARGESLATRLDAIARGHGLHLTDQIAVRVDELGELDELMARLRSRPPGELVGIPVTVTDLDTPDGDLPATDALIWASERASVGRPSVRVVVRPSGTEPKLKCYLELAAHAEDSIDIDAIRERLGSVLQQLRDEVSALVGAGR